MNHAGDTMNLLNEAASRFPDATSFMSGRPPDEFVDIRVLQDWINRFVVSRPDSERTWKELGQYSDTNGIIRDILAEYFIARGAASTKPEHCMITNGAQEGMIIALKGLCSDSRVAIAADPTYTGFSGAAQISGVPLETVVEDDDFVDRLVRRVEKGTPKAGCIYLIPDFSNPTGRVLTLQERLRILDAARRANAIVIEDSAYRYYRYEGIEIPTLYSLSNGENVILLESFSKTILPGLRISALVTGAKDHDGRPLIDRLSQIKSYISVVTSPIHQAALGGFLLMHGNEMSGWMDRRIQRLRQNRDALLEALIAEFTEGNAATWNRPSGGFFLCVNLRHSFDLHDCVRCAAEAKVLILPARLLSDSRQYDSHVRLSFSNVRKESIPPATKRFANWLSGR